jgi:hypothetical protein
MNTIKTELKATLQKSYYGKAQVYVNDYYIVLKSYNTYVLAIDRKTNKLIRHWNGWSSTSAKHINDFLMQYGFSPVSKKQWLAMPCDNNTAVFNVYYSTGFVTHKGTALLTEKECEKEVEKTLKNRPRLYCWYE